MTNLYKNISIYIFFLIFIPITFLVIDRNTQQLKLEFTHDLDDINIMEDLQIAMFNFLYVNDQIFAKNLQVEKTHFIDLDIDKHMKLIKDNNMINNFYDILNRLIKPKGFFGTIWNDKKFNFTKSIDDNSFEEYNKLLQNSFKKTNSQMIMQIEDSLINLINSRILFIEESIAFIKKNKDDLKKRLFVDIDDYISTFTLLVDRGKISKNSNDFQIDIIKDVITDLELTKSFLQEDLNIDYQMLIQISKFKNINLYAKEIVDSVMSYGKMSSQIIDLNSSKQTLSSSTVNLDKNFEFISYNNPKVTKKTFFGTQKNDVFVILSGLVIGFIIASSLILLINFRKELFSDI